MKGLFSRVLVSGLLLGSGLGTVVGLSGCGSGGSANDQGVAFSLNGFYDGVDGNPLSGYYRATFGAELPFVAVETQNNLIGQGIRVRRVYLNYSIPAAGITLPSTSAALTATLGPVECTNGPSVPECVDTTLPPAFMNANVAKSEFNLIPPTINEYLLLNRDSLPSLPFTMEVQIIAEGTTTAGDTLRTNEGNFNIDYVSDDGVAEPDSAA